ncbi:MAG: fumarylacetoacetate hydrolase family protein [Flavobacteriaceae bacterium]|jgi:2-keto-4-pentenoate hydratase/2-oxohepta-3-ene-1,7-dioic acid hydratase in catechol pathway|nr:fumarylacetoacetate hydrolase family protein [Flavobacteriaceae bacterium]
MKIICVGRNYGAHIEELANQRPSEPVLFLKPDSAVILKNNPFIIPTFSNDIHFEVEVLVKINKIGKHIDRTFAHNYYDSIGLGIDFTARDLQSTLKAKGLPWERAKAFDGSAQIGNFVSKSSFEEVQNIEFRLERNNEVVQVGNTKDMLWQIDELIEYISKYFTLKIGDIIFTGTPAGVGRVAPQDVLTGYLADLESFSVKIK